MEAENGQSAEPAYTDADLVVIDRTALNQLLDAVANVLAVARGVEQLGAAGELKPELREQSATELAHASDALIEGIAQMKDSVRQLPSVTLNDQS